MDMELKGKTVKESRTVKASLILPSDTNHHGTIFGGTIMSYVDEVSAIAAMRHSRRPVVTASIDSVDFIVPAKLGFSVCVDAFVTSTGRTSVEVFVKIISENLQTGERQLTATSFVTFVALDEHGKPTPVPPIIPETEEEVYLYQTAPQRIKMRRERRNATQQFYDSLDITKDI
ncbi:acyl-CoA thioesterase [Brevibacillus laterosporus]|uniref:Acyl-CoA thioesterase n=1 Tax=Brevibacillus laterosporus TaxID=1465 RepID=A0A502ISE3_BRELA|nr:acyl-CoA thioesterase [Brevibacillus laterosporus]QDX93342.1 acyl-CoA thioesterase [Brevibacillus laterosporus]RAP24003.1 Acyl-CoA hydrolase [Brevibacillus laterosporus]TPG73087.1 acyl-CoA thioesterase [Brevibacillus laterosporus]TPG88356.1 acyl-CoA thioesterase [Brevibacillus laterosporus]